MGSWREFTLIMLISIAVVYRKFAKQLVILRRDGDGLYAVMWGLGLLIVSPLILVCLAFTALRRPGHLIHLVFRRFFSASRGIR